MKIQNLFREKPLGLKIIIIIYSIATIAYFSLGIALFSSKELINKIPDFKPVSIPGVQASLIIGIIFIFLSVLCLFIVKGLLTSKNWARIILIIFCSLNVFGGIFSLAKGNFLSLINIIFNLAIISYFILNKNAKKQFT